VIRPFLQLSKCCRSSLTPLVTRTKEPLLPAGLGGAVGTVLLHEVTCPPPDVDRSCYEPSAAVVVVHTSDAVEMLPRLELIVTLPKPYRRRESLLTVMFGSTCAVIRTSGVVELLTVRVDAAVTTTPNRCCRRLGVAGRDRFLHEVVARRRLFEAYEPVGRRRGCSYQCDAVALLPWMVQLMSRPRQRRLS